MRLVFAAASLALPLGVLALSACVHTPAERPVVHSACASGTERVYFARDSQDLPRGSQPILAHVAHYVRECAAQGGELVSLSVVAFPDRGETGDEADTLADARAQEVRDALVVAGAPADKIEIIDHRLRREDPDRIMRRHATIRYEQR